MANWFVYILRCRDDSLYTGIAADLDRRLEAHGRGTASRYTRTRLPVKLVYHETRRDRSSASRREAEIKALPRDRKLALIRSASGRPGASRAGSLRSRSPTGPGGESR